MNINWKTEKFLGNVISTKESSMTNVFTRKEKSIGIIKQIGSLFNDANFGSFFLLQKARSLNFIDM